MSRATSLLYAFSLMALALVAVHMLPANRALPGLNMRNPAPPPRSKNTLPPHPVGHTAALTETTVNTTNATPQPPAVANSVNVGLNPSTPAAVHRTIKADLARSLEEVAINKVVLMTTASKEFSLYVKRCALRSGILCCARSLHADVLTFRCLCGGCPYVHRILNNWICHIKKLGITNVIIFALDVPTVKQVTSHGLVGLLDATFDKGNGTIKEFGSESYNHAVYAKTKHQLGILRAGYSLFFSDADIPWTHNWIDDVAKSTGNAIDLVRCCAWGAVRALCVQCEQLYWRPSVRASSILCLCVMLGSVVGRSSCVVDASLAPTHAAKLQPRNNCSCFFLGGVGAINWMALA